MNNFDEMIKEANLNSAQKKFCKSPINKNVRLLAPAGSGKTYSLLWRCKYIDEQYKLKGNKAKFLVLTFTKTAQKEIESRLTENPCFQDMNVTARTLNSWGWGQLTETNKQLLNNPKSRYNVATHDLLHVIKNYPRINDVMKSSQLQKNNAPIIMDLLDEYKALGFTHKMKKSDYNAHVKYLQKQLGLVDYLNELFNQIKSLEKVSILNKKDADNAVYDFFNFFKDATKLIKESNRYTMEDQKYWARIQLEEKIENKNYPVANNCYTHILIDEFQDINPLDLYLIKAISKYNGRGKNVNFTIVGDDDQAIFGWRGTTPQYILNPEVYFEEKFNTYILENNYRSPKVIVDASQKLIKFNRTRVDKSIKSKVSGRAYVKVVNKKTEIKTMDSVLDIIKDSLQKDPDKSIALISRTQATLFPYQVLLSSQKIDYNVAADIDIFDGEAMESFLKILKVVYIAKNDDTDDAVEDLLTIIDKIARNTLSTQDKSKIRKYFGRKNISTLLDAANLLKDYPYDIKKENPELFSDIVIDLLNSKTVKSFMKIILNDFYGFDKDYNKADEDTHYKNPQFENLMNMSGKYGEDFKAFHRDIYSAKKNSKLCRERYRLKEDADYGEINEIKLHLLTATRSKGLEFDTVIIIDADEDAWPNQLSEDLEAERRLFYVAMTRAKKYLYFIVPKEKICSRFLLEAGVYN